MFGQVFNFVVCVFDDFFCQIDFGVCLFQLDMCDWCFVGFYVWCFFNVVFGEFFQKFFEYMLVCFKDGKGYDC